MTQDDDAPRNRVADRIIRSRGEVPAADRSDGGNDDHAYKAAWVTEGFPQMGFSLFCSNGKRHAFLYHNIDNLELTEGKHGMYITLAHRGKVATIRGENMHSMFDAMLEHTLQALYQFDTKLYPDPPKGEALIDFIRVQRIHPTPKPSEEDEVSGVEERTT